MSKKNTPPPVSTDADPYALLGISTIASEAEIKQAYFKQVRQHPPEKDPQMFKQIRAAYEKLKDPQKRLEADLLRVEIWPEPVLEVKRKTKAGIPLQTEDVRQAARAFTEVGKQDFREDYRPVKLKP